MDGIQITNGSGGTLNSITIGFDGEQWRKLDNASAQTMVLEYGFGPTFSGVTTWNAPGNSFNWSTPVFSSAAAAAVNGNLAGLVSSRGGTISGLTWGSSQSLWIRWVERNDAGNDHALAIDNFTFTASASATPSIALSSPSQIAAGNVNQGATSHILSNFQAAVTAADASLSAMTIVTDGTYSSSSHVSNYKLMYNASSNTFGSAIQIGTTQPSVASAGTITFSSLNTTITNGNTGYFWITADIDANATAAQTVSIAANPTFTFASGSPTGSISASGAQTFVAVTPNIAISSNHPTASGINQNATNQVFGSIALAATTANASLNSVTITTGGTYQISDLVASSFKLYYTTSNVFSAATQLGSAQAIVASGNTITFSGLSQIINSGVTGYLWFTADVAYNAVNGRTLSTASTAFNNITFATGNKTGVDPVVAGNDHTVTTVTPNVTISQVGPTVGNIINNINNQILYQLSLVTADNATDINSLTLNTAGTYVPSDLTANGFKLWYNTVNSLSGATQLGSGQGIVSTGNTITFSGLTQKLNIGTSFLLLTVDVASGATPGNDINITSTPFANISLSAGNKLGTDPSNAGGLKTIRIDVAVGDVVINQFSPDYSGASNEYVEIVNKTGNTIDLSTLKLAYQSASGSLASSTGATLSGSLAPYSFWLLSPDTPITTGLTSNLNRDGSFTAGFAGASGQIAIQRVSDNTIIDAVGYGTLTGGTFSEGTPALSPTTDGGLRRVIDGADTGVNSTDYTTVTNANIYLRNSNSRLGIAGSTIGAGTYTDFVVTGNTSLSGAVNVTNRLSLIGGTLTTGGNLTLKSSSTRTANVPPITGAITGNVTVERFIPARRAYRFLSPSVTTSTTIRQNWQEDGVNTPGFGTHITGATGASAGFDPTETNNSSLLLFTSGAWVGATSTNVSLTAGNAYCLMVRGDRTTILTTNTPDTSNTVLRATGTLFTGNFSPVLSAAASGYSFVGNPYQAPLDIKTALQSSTDVNKNVVYYWDPTINDRGGYITRNLQASENSPNNTSVNDYVQPGQAFFLVNEPTLTGTPALTFTENHKSVANAAAGVFRNANTSEYGTLRVNLQANKNNQWQTIEGALAIFNDNFSWNVTSEDATKIANLDEDVSFVQNNTSLAIACQSNPSTTSELPLKIERMRHSAYQWQFELDNYEGESAYLFDAVNNSFTAITHGTVVPFTADANTTNRFKIVFQTSALSTDDFTNNIKLYPNPAKAGASFYIDGITEATVSVYNVVGQNIPVTVMSQGNATQVTPTAALSQGVYLVTVTTAGKTTQVKWIVE